jgi:hypothetical protein
MSETVHYKGVANKIKQPNDKTLIDVAEEILKERNYGMANYYDSAIECICQEFNNEFFYHPKTQTLYEISYTDHDLDEEIITAKYIGFDNSQVGFELRYYNGGAGFEECLEEAFDKLK